MKRLLCCTLLLASGLVSTSLSQCINEENSPTRSRDRQLVNPKGEGVLADITVFDQDRRVVFQTRSKRNGKFSIGRLESGEYWVQVDAPGFDRYRYKLSSSGEPRKILKLLPYGVTGCTDMMVGPNDSAQKVKEPKE